MKAATASALTVKANGVTLAGVHVLAPFVSDATGTDSSRKADRSTPSLKRTSPPDS